MKTVWHAFGCPITGKSGEEVATVTIDFKKDFPEDGHYWFYFIPKKILLIVEDNLYFDTEFWKQNRREIEFILHNGLWPSGNRMLSKRDLKALISSSTIPSNPKDKLREVLLFLKLNTSFFGQVLYPKQKFLFDDHMLKSTGMVNEDEFERIIYTGIELGFLNNEGSTKDSLPVSLAFTGWDESENLEELKRSKTAFVVLSFLPEMIQVFEEWIRPAIEKCGFLPKIIFDDPIASDQTVNDAILAGIKNSKFTIADFTYHRNGVYFEAGYALGRGQQVIYSCREDEIGSAHFDIRNYQHLVWKDGPDLKKKLMDKIEVFIKM